ncbi:thiamine biosynthesis protein ThiS [Methylosinus sp. R-45379]|jgi:sulfur carrier protein|uniref:sulfur carrier protein ThiS n=1 Tax=Methylosinus sp. sav-2 TaxID=2485168 RepID=UPI0004647682|nr:sulfur carrier protein ThiS [Methylosinus sp. sav-2]OAI31805.1 thiamine biosynthesis protein ThiS [Methylosinus sp. R-45379]TDX67426.1 sulfur carrier protein [Methylosinus sp. sav-2]
MRIRVNGQTLEIEAPTLERLIEELGFSEQTVATAVNQEFVRSKDRGETLLVEDDTIEIVTPRQGG